MLTYRDKVLYHLLFTNFLANLYTPAPPENTVLYIIFLRKDSFLFFHIYFNLLAPGAITLIDFL